MDAEAAECLGVPGFEIQHFVPEILGFLEAARVGQATGSFDQSVHFSTHNRQGSPSTGPTQCA